MTHSVGSLVLVRVIRGHVREGEMRVRLPLMRVVVAAFALSFAVFPVVALSSEYEAVVIERRFGSAVFPFLDSDLGPVDAAASATWTGINNSSGVASAIAESGSTIGLISLGATGNGGFVPQSAAEGMVIATATVDDIMITGPATTVDVSMNIEWGGFANVVESGPNSTTTVIRELGFQLAEAGTNFCNTNFQLVSVNGANAGALVHTTPVINCPTDVPLTATIRFELIGFAETRFTQTASVVADASNGASFATSGPVFNLPPGFTANSLDGSIVDNVYLPEAHGAAALLPCLVLLAQFARTRRAIRRNRHGDAQHARSSDSSSKASWSSS